MIKYFKLHANRCWCYFHGFMTCVLVISLFVNYVFWKGYLWRSTDMTGSMTTEFSNPKKGN